VLFVKHLKIYRAIRLIHRTGSIRKAAVELAISPSALNRSLQAFEDELSYQVFDRVPGGVRLSEAGELLIDVIDRHLVEFGELRAQLGSLRDGAIGELRISIGGDIASGVALDCISEVEDHFPGLSVEIVSDDTTQSLLERRVHLALLTNPITDDAAEVVYASETEIGVWAARPLSDTPRGIWDLSDRRVIVAGEGSGSRIAISHVLRRNRLTLNKITATTAARLTLDMRRSDAICVFPDVAVEQGLYQRLPFDFGKVQICAVRLAGMPMIRPFQTYLTLLQRHLEKR
jgi:DNA-binding transcriptional LysR family regulator